MPKTTPEIKLEPGLHRLPLDTFKPNDDNPRAISDEDFARLREDVKDEHFQQARPMLGDIDKRDIVGGNQRWRALHANGATEGWFWVEDFSGPGGDDRREEWLFKDNGEYGQWVPDAVATILKARQDRGAAVDILGFRSTSVEQLLSVSGYTRRLKDPDAQPGPEPEEPVTKHGDVIKLGQHTLMCGDSRDPAQVAALMDAHGAGQAQMLYTDPPYGVNYEGGAKKRDKLEGDELSTGIYGLFLPALAQAKALDDLAPMYLWYADCELAKVVPALMASGWDIRTGIVWVKNNAQFISPARYKHLHEPILYCAPEGDATRWYGPNNEVTVWEADRAQSNEFHPTQKPVELAERAIRNSTREGDTVLDLFGGSGATLIGGETTNRRVAMMEIKPGYCDVVCTRYEAVTGEKAKR